MSEKQMWVWVHKQADAWIAKLEKRLIFWIRQQVKGAGARGVVLGLSGGVDSATVAVLSQKAVGKNLLALILPCHSSRQDILDARLVAKKFKLKTRLIDLSKIYDSLVKILPSAGKMVYANLKPRLRMLVLYYFANKLNYLVAGTGNKSEIMVGYFTKHGDGATDILPIGNLFKIEVRMLARRLGIPEKIIHKKPTAGLWPGQTDEGEMGITYGELDFILRDLESKRKQVLSLSKVNKVKQMIVKSQHKRQLPAVFKY